MRVDDLIVLEDGKRYSLVEQTDFEGETYFLAAAVDANDEPLENEIVILQSVEEDGELYVELVTQEKLIVKLTKIFQTKMKEEK